MGEKSRRLLAVSIVLAGALIGIVVALAGCTKNPVTVTNLPPGITSAQVNSWITASSDLDKAYALTHAVKESVIGIRNAGAWTDDASYAKALEGTGKALQLEIAAANALKQQPNSWSTSMTATINGLTNEALTALTDVVNAGTLGVKNQTSKQQLLGLIGNAATILKLVLSLAAQPVALQPANSFYFVETIKENYYEFAVATA